MLFIPKKCLNSCPCKLYFYINQNQDITFTNASSTEPKNHKNDHCYGIAQTVFNTISCLGDHEQSKRRLSNKLECISDQSELNYLAKKTHNNRNRILIENVVYEDVI